MVVNATPAAIARSRVGGSSICGFVWEEGGREVSGEGSWRSCVWVSPELFFKFKCSTLFSESGNSVHVTRVSSIVLGPIISMKLKLAFAQLV